MEQTANPGRVRGQKKDKFWDWCKFFSIDWAIQRGRQAIWAIRHRYKKHEIEAGLKVQTEEEDIKIAEETETNPGVKDEKEAKTWEEKIR